MFQSIRLYSQQLTTPAFEQPREIVSWMGAIQGQDHNMSKWAVGVRLKSASLQTVEEALEKGEILRTHVMRPTWHLVTSEDIRWMIKLSEKRLKTCWGSKDKELEITTTFINSCNRLLEKLLKGNNHMTKQELGEALSKTGIENDSMRMNRILFQAEAEGIVCSGIDKNKKHTYALLEERVPPTKELHKDEALAKLALKYFRSHSPTTLSDFVWWSGLSITEARQAIGLIRPELITDRHHAGEVYIHQSLSSRKPAGEVLHFLPPYDEYLISYKDRGAVLASEHYPKAFTKYGIFYPVILHNGQIVGNWKKTTCKGQISIETAFFDRKLKIDKEIILAAKEKYIKTFLKN